MKTLHLTYSQKTMNRVCKFLGIKIGVKGVVPLYAVPRAAVYIWYYYGNTVPRARLSIRGYVVEKAGLDTLINRKRSTHLD